jgi:hypothetical protein
MRISAFSALAAECAVALVLSGAEPEQARAQARDSGAFVARLGRDTIAIERYVVSGGRIEAVGVTRSPRTVVRRLVIVLAEDGTVSRFATAMEGQPLEERPPAAAGGIPLVGQFNVPWELALRRAARAGGDSAIVTVLSGGQPRQTVIRRTAADSYTYLNQNDIAVRATVDRAGRLLALDAGGGNTVTRVDRLDIEGLARAFAARDERGEGLGALSPRDSARAVIAGASILVDYSRPSLRGRDLRLLVPYDQVWRTGANDATHFRTDRDLAIGDATVPAGTYTLFTLPSAAGWMLIINRQTGQSGLEYDASRDLSRVRMAVREGPHVEKFTIDVRAEGNGGLLELKWGRTIAAVPVRVTR